MHVILEKNKKISKNKKHILFPQNLFRQTKLFHTIWTSEKKKLNCGTHQKMVKRNITIINARWKFSRKKPTMRSRSDIPRIAVNVL